MSFVLLIPWLVSLVALLGVIYISPHGLRKFQEIRLRSQCSKEHVLVLTYDDGPSEGATPRLLDLLAEHGAKATFYLMGERVASAPQAFQRLLDEGHELGSHSQAHLNAWKVSPWRSVADVKVGLATLKQLGIKVNLFRPPYGKNNLLTWLTVVWQRIGFGWWTVVSGDTYAKLPDPASVVSLVERNGGGVVLMHDFDRTEDRTNFVLEVTRLLLNTAKARGWRVCTQGELQTR